MSGEASSFIIRCLPVNGQPFSYQLGDQPIVVGSSTDAHIHVDSHAVSRQHFRVTLRNGRIYIVDLGSRTGTYLNGQKLSPNLEYEWQPGNVLRIPDVEFELTYPYAAEAAPATTAAKGDFNLTATPDTVKPLQNIQLSLAYHGKSQQHVTLQAQPLTPGFLVNLSSNGGTLPPDGSLQATAQINKTKPFWRGGQFRVRFAANALSGLIDTAEVVVKVRPRYEALLLLLLIPLPFIIALMLSRPENIIAELPTLSPTIATATEATEEPTSTATATSTLTITPTATVPTITVSAVVPTTVIPPSACFVQCNAFGWRNYVIQPGDTLSSLAQRHGTNLSTVQQVNCIADPNQLFAGTTICLPNVPTITPLTCNGFGLVSPQLFPQGQIDFFWNSPTDFVPSSYRLDIFNAANGVLMATREVVGATTARVDVSWAMLGQYSSATWRVQANYNGFPLCSAQQTVSIQTPVAPTTPAPQFVDLVITDIRPVYDDAECVDPPSTYNLPFHVTVQNQGTVTAAAGVATTIQTFARDATTGIWRDRNSVTTASALAAGQSMVMTIDLTVTALTPEGVRAITNTGATHIAESRTDNNTSRELSLKNSELLPCVPDLTIPQVTVNYGDAECASAVEFDGPITQGTRNKHLSARQVQEIPDIYDIPVSVTIVNQGGAAVPAGVNVAIQLQSGESDWGDADMVVTTTELSPGESEVVTGRIRVADSNDYDLRAVADSTEAVDESDEENDISAIQTLDMDSLPPCSPDFIITNITPLYDELDCEARTLPVEITVVNDNGSLAPAGIPVDLQMATEGWETVNTVFTTLALGSGDSETVTATLNVDEGEPLIRAVVNLGEGAVPERNTRNNVSEEIDLSEAEPIECVYDLTITSITPLYEELDCETNELPFLITVLNQGNLGTDNPVEVSLQIGSSIDTVWFDWETGISSQRLLADGNEIVRLVPELQGGMPSLVRAVVASVDEALPERNTENNISPEVRFDFEQLSCDQPDLVITDVTPIYGQADCESQTVPIQITVLNQGNTSAPQGIVVWLQRPDDGEWSDWDFTRTAAALAPNATEVVVVPIQLFEEESPSIRSTVNLGENQAEESDYDNNISAEVTIDIGQLPPCVTPDPDPQSLPDLTVDITEATAFCIQTNCVIHLTYTITNNGVVDVPAFTAEYTVGNSDPVSFPVAPLAANANVSNRVTGAGDCPDTEPLCDVTVRVDSINTVPESNEENNVSIRRAAEIVTPEPSLPDLTVTVNSVNARCVEGCVVDVGYTISNIGTGGQFAPFDVTFLISESVADSITIDQLVAGDSTTNPITIPANDICINPGCTVTAVVDFNATVSESNETNNQSSLRTIPPDPEPLPDLTVTIDSAIAGCDDGCFVTFSYTVTNNSGVDTDTFQVDYEIENTASDSVTVSLTAGSSFSDTVTVPADDACINPGCLVTVSVDTGDIVVESNEGNNVDSELTTGIVTPDLPDLIAALGSVLSNDCEGDSCTVSFTFTVTNIGGADAGAFNIDIQGTTDAFGSASSSGIEANSSENFTGQAASAGNCFEPNCTITIQVDSGDTVAESDESNNSATQTFGG